MSTINIKSVMLYNVRRVRPQTLEAIANARDGDMIPVDPTEMDAFMQLTFNASEMKSVAKIREEGPGK